MVIDSSVPPSLRSVVRSIALLFFTLLCLTAAPTLAQQTTGVLLNEAGASDTLTLLSPADTDVTYLLDKQGTVVNQWQASARPGMVAYLLSDGALVRTAAPNGQDGNGSILAHGAGGLIERWNWDGIKTWEFAYDSPTVLQHHDIEVLPNGNVLLIAWELKTQAEVEQAGRDDALPGPGFLYPDHIVEVEPDPSGVGGTIVWEWHVWDHLVQQHDPTKDNYYGPTGVADHPELIDINYVPDPQGGGLSGENFTHVNSIDYHADLDQILVSVRQFNEIWVIDHSTTTAEAAAHTGGNSGKGGDLLYRWGNPAAYGRGDASDRVFFYQHDARWIPAGSPGAGKITVFNNGVGRPGTEFSTVEEIQPPVDELGNYLLPGGQSFGPASPDWTYNAPSENFSPLLSGAERLPNGNTLITYGVSGVVSEVTAAGEEVWRYVSPYTLAGELGSEEPIPSLGLPGPYFDTLLANFTSSASAPDYSIDTGTNEPADSVEINFAPASPTAVGTPVTISSDASGGSGTYEYQFRIRGPATGNSWQLLQDYSAASEVVWDTTGFVGRNKVQVRARNSGSTDVPARKNRKYVVTSANPATGVTLVASLPSPQSVGVDVILSAVPEGGGGAFDYQYRVRGPSTGNAWILLQDFGPNDSVIWNTAGYPGSNRLQVRIRNAGTADVPVADKLRYHVNSATPATGVDFNLDQTSPQPIGTVITGTAVGQGGTGSYEYRFHVKGPGTGGWTMLQDYAPDNELHWVTSGLAAGQYRLRVQARNLGTSDKPVKRTRKILIGPP